MFDGICIRASVVCGYLFNTTIMFKSVRGDWLCDVYLATIKQRLQDNLKQGFDGEMKNSVKCCNYHYIVDNFLVWTNI
jgi:hypothetical protein